jgi:transposase-like protein
VLRAGIHHPLIDSCRPSLTTSNTPRPTSSPSPHSPRNCGVQVWSNNPQERLNREIRRRTEVVGIFPNRDAIIQLVGAVLAVQADEWAEGRRYLDLDLLTRSTKINNVDPAADTKINTDTPKEAEPLPAPTA